MSPYVPSVTMRKKSITNILYSRFPASVIVPTTVPYLSSPFHWNTTSNQHYNTTPIYLLATRPPGTFPQGLLFYVVACLSLSRVVFVVRSTTINLSFVLTSSRRSKKTNRILQSNSKSESQKFGRPKRFLLPVKYIYYYSI